MEAKEAMEAISAVTIMPELALPSHVTIQVSRRCNLHCPMCGWSIWSRNSGTMSAAVFSRVMEEMTCNGLKTLDMTGAQGEPLLAPQCCDYIDTAVEAGIVVELNTNCTPLGDRSIARLAAAAERSRNLRIQLSFSGYDQASYEFVYAGARFADSSKKLKKIYDAFAAINQLSSLCIRGMILDGSAPERHAEYVRSIGVEPSNLGYHWLGPADNFAGLVPYGYKGGGTVHFCSILARGLIVYDDGKVSACMCRDSEGAMEIGDIMTEGFREMRAGPRFRSFVDAFLNNDLSALSLCRNCEHAHA